MVRNCYGKRIKQIDVIADSSFQKADGSVNWGLVVNGDEHGFDLGRLMENGEYVIRDFVIPKGTRIIRYGDNHGRFSAPYGTPYEKLSLPFLKETRPYHEYVVNKACKIKCVVVKGYVAKGFSSEGGVIQFFHPDGVHECLRKKILKEDYRWLIKTLLKL